MNASYDVLSAFLDDEPFDPQQLVNALSEPAGRALLIDLLALRRMVQPTETISAMQRPAVARRFGWRSGVAAAAVLLLAVTGGYFAGMRGSQTTSVRRRPRRAWCKPCRSIPPEAL
jgi:hypothetical protein